MSEKILVADESPTVRNVAESLLKKHGYTVLLADDGARALEVAKRDKPELIFLDDSVSVPGGKEKCSTFRREAGLEDVPVVMLLSGDKGERQQELKDIGANGFISKPFNPREILEHAERLLRKDTVPSAGEEQDKTEEASPTEDHVSEEKERDQVVPPVDKGKLEDGLNILETSDVMENYGPSAPGSEEEPSHGFDWFLYELKKETQALDETTSPVEEKPGPSAVEASHEEVKPQKESRPYRTGEHAKSFEDFVKDLREEVEQPGDEEVAKSGPSAEKAIDRHQLDQLISHLKERIPERVAQEVAEKLSPEFLERIIREEIDRINKG
jgi:two-component system alkaline phosphatase synthesis response regulator PhoP